jgi:biopolymer transport protein ExbB
MIAYFTQAGPLIWAILAVSIWAFALIVERFWTLRRLSREVKQQSVYWFEILQNAGPQEAFQKLQGQEGLVAEILQEAWEPKHSMEAAEKGVEEVISRHLPHLDRHLGTIGTLGSLEPMIGLLGTVTGLIQSFGGLSTAGGDLASVSGGLAIAMINTQAGLFTALPILLILQYLRNRQRDLLGEIQTVCARALKWGHRNVTPSSL